MRSSLPLGLLFVTAACVSLIGQQLTARDAFWSASDLVTLSSNPGRQNPAKRKFPHTANVQPAPASANPVAHVDPVLVVENGYGDKPHFVPVSDGQIGLRYSLLLRDAAGSYAEVSPHAVFHSGDHLRLTVMANQPGYLYVIQQGSTGSWSPIFPAAGSSGSINEVEQGRIYQIPNGSSAFRFDQNPGQEKLFMVLSRQRIHDLESTIQSLKGPGGKGTGVTPPTQGKPRPEDPVYEASNHIPDDIMQRLASRDLTLVQEQQVDVVSKGNDLGEKAVYVVSKGVVMNDGPLVVAYIILRHD